MITLNNINFKYPNSKFKLANINYNFNDNKIYAIIGNNGSGKSTLTQIISGILKPQKGEVLINNEKLKNIKKKNIVKIGIVFSNPDNQIIFNNVYDDIAFILKNYKIDKSEFEERINYALTCVDMLEFKNSETFNLSSGQKQRIAIAGMLSLKPEILIFDECTSLLDPTAKNELYKLFTELNKLGITIIFTTNIINEIIIANEVIIMDKGEIVVSENPINLIKDLSTFEKLKMAVPTKLKLFNILLNKNQKFERFTLIDNDKYGSLESETADKFTEVTLNAPL